MRKQLLLSLFPLAIIFAFGYPVMTDPDRKDSDDFGADSTSGISTATIGANRMSRMSTTAAGKPEGGSANSSRQDFSSSRENFSDLMPGWAIMDKILFDGTIL